MTSIGTEILVVGGGATGLSTARDALLRGFKTIVIEKGDLAHGTSGRYHGLLHSGGRYVVSDPPSAAECWHENQTLRRLMPSAIEDTGGLFVNLLEDPEDYIVQFKSGCDAAGIPCQPLTPAQVLAEEPLLTSKIRAAFRVPDAACDSFDALHILADDIRRQGGIVLLRHRAIDAIIERGRVRGMMVEDLATGEEKRIYSDMVLNCAGPWAGHIAGLAGLDVQVTPGKGTMIAMNARLVNTVVNRCKPPDDGDILVPVGTVSVIGTTEVVVDSPDKYPMEDWEVELLMAEGAKLVPGFRNYRPLRAWAGVRPLFKEHKKAAAGATDSRNISRAQSILNHRTRDGLPGIMTIVGGKFTTMRLMAEQLLNAACAELLVERTCVTAATPIEQPGAKMHTLPARLHAREDKRANTDAPLDPLVCECEFVTESMVNAALDAGRDGDPVVLNDIRRDTRLGMGPCQAGFCGYRAIGVAQQRQSLSGHDASRSLSQFLQERWKGQRPLLWGANLRQAALDQHIYQHLLGISRLPGARSIEAYPDEAVS